MSQTLGLAQRSTKRESCNQMPIGILLSQKWYKNLVELTFEVELFPYNSITSFHHSGETKHKDHLLSSKGSLHLCNLCQLYLRLRMICATTHIGKLPSWLICATTHIGKLPVWLICATVLHHASYQIIVSSLVCKQGS